MLFFYKGKSQSPPSQAMTAIGVLEDLNLAHSTRELLQMTGGRSVYSDQDLAKWGASANSPVKVINYLLAAYRPRHRPRATQGYRHHRRASAPINLQDRTERDPHVIIESQSRIHDMNSRRVIAVIGLSGVGKSALISCARKSFEFEHLQASSLISAERARRREAPINHDALREANIDDNQTLLVAMTKCDMSSIRNTFASISITPFGLSITVCPSKTIIPDFGAE